MALKLIFIVSIELYLTMVNHFSGADLATQKVR